ncbi:MAG TPA: hypothetical protein PLM95_14190 [Ottowia sp.]|uniref:hypothetical protein n=1 Tax=Ottowia sp. TaxID=1898956 RepID=UPI002C34224C|nr:hypothetical protein [Ottowia sp.]HRN07976.1 hypothetical protein [Ottowia sp.]
MNSSEPDPRIQSILEWNRLARENTENAIVSSMFEAGFQASESIEVFSAWLLVGTATIASFIIINAEKLAPFIGRQGFIVCGSLLCGSCLLGIVSRILALKCKIQIQTSSAVRKTFAEHLHKHVEEEKKIEGSVTMLGITVETGIRLDRILSEFFSPLPKWVQWLAQRQIKKYAKNPQAAFIPIVKSMQYQGLFAILQAIAFLAFLAAGFVYVAARAGAA